MTNPPDRLTILIASPLEAHHVERIRRFRPERFEVLYEEQLLPRPRYVADHSGGRARAHAGSAATVGRAAVPAPISCSISTSIDPAGLPSRARRLRWVQATSAGIGEFLARTGRRSSGIIFTTAAGVHARSLAEFAMLGLLYFFRGMPHLAEIKAARHWQRYTVRGLEGARLLVVGLGSVGREVARQAAFSVSRSRACAGTLAANCRRAYRDWSASGGLREALAECDALVIACPLTEETKGMIGAAEIGAFKTGMVLVNIARGGVINETEMIAALRDGRIAGAALDVFATEPLPADNPLWGLPNVIISPHSASTVAAENGRIVDIFLDNLQRFEAGMPMRNRYEAGRGY